MITAREALALPSAQISESDAAAVRDLIAEIDDYIRSHMTRNGCEIPVEATKLNNVIAAEIARVYRQGGWHGEIVAMQAPSRLNGGMIIASYKVRLTPVDSAYQSDGAAPTEVYSAPKVQLS